VAPVVSYKSLLADFGKQLGGALRINTHLKQLKDYGFITRKGEDIAEGPLLDLLLDYDLLAPRILDGALADVLARSTDATVAPELALIQQKRQEPEQPEEQAEGQD
jgi:hypothetical protein